MPFRELSGTSSVVIPVWLCNGRTDAADRQMLREGLGKDQRRGIWSAVRCHAGQDNHGSVSMEPTVELEQRKKANKIIMKCSQSSKAKK